MLKAIDETFNEGDHSVSNIFKQIKPFEKTKGLMGIWSTKVTAGLSIGYNINKLNIIKYSYLHNCH